MGTATTTVVAYGRQVQGAYKNTVSIVPSATYATAGETVTTADTGLSAVTTVNFHGGVGGYTPEWNSGKMRIRSIPNGVEVTSGANLSSLTFYATVLGTPPTGG